MHYEAAWGIKKKQGMSLDRRGDRAVVGELPKSMGMINGRWGDQLTLQKSAEKKYLFRKFRVPFHKIRIRFGSSWRLWGSGGDLDVDMVGWNCGDVKICKFGGVVVTV